jgi:hypothetical protein
MWMVVGVIPTSLPAAAAPVLPVALAEPVELPAAVVVELPLGWLDEELHAPAAKTAASAIVKSARKRARTKRPGAEVALIRPRATVLSLAMVIPPLEIPFPLVSSSRPWRGNVRVPLNGTRTRGHWRGLALSGSGGGEGHDSFRIN